MSVKVRASPISRAAAILIIAVGAFVLFGGLVTGTLVSDIAGVAFILLGAVLYSLLFRLTRKMERELSGAEKD